MYAAIYPIAIFRTRIPDANVLLFLTLESGVDFVLITHLLF